MSPSTPIRPRRPLSYVGLLGWCLLGGMLVGGAMALLDHFGGPAAQPLRAALIVASLIGVFGVTVAWWRGADEAVREAHKWAWFWGGSAGMTVGLGALLMLSYGGVVVPVLPDAGPNAEVMLGAMGMLLVMMVGYLVAWAAWWLRHR